MLRRVLAALLLSAVLLLGWANWPVSRLPVDARTDRIVVEKAARRLTLYNGKRVLKIYAVALGRDPTGPKQTEGDERTPEGSYVIDGRLQASTFHLALHISYPNETDKAAARRAGVDPGGAIMVHGIRNGLGWVGRLHRMVDWTSGCIAVTNPEIEELWRTVPNGTPVEIRP